ncbi:MAG: nucleoside deaminase, partial [Anaeroplasmataceae bacterium]
MYNELNIRFMKEAIKQAKKAYKIDEVPVGCVIVKGDEIIARSYNKREQTQNSLMHAEIIAIDKACKKLNSWRLDECDIYVTLEPCAMCGGAIIQSKFKNVYYAAPDIKTGSCGGKFNLFDIKFN